MQLSELRTRLELILSIPSSDAYVSSSTQLSDLNAAYEATAYAYDFPQLLVRRGRRLLTNQRKYANPSNLRKYHKIFALGKELKEVDLYLVRRVPYSYAVDRETDELIVNLIPSSNGTEYTITNAESAGQTITIEVNSVSSLAAGDEIVFPDDGNPEVTFVATVDSSAVTITARLDTSKSASAVFYKGVDNLMFDYYRTITALSAAGDEPLLPSAIHHLIPHYASYIAYLRLEEFQKAENHRQLWERELGAHWRAFDKNSTGQAGQFSVY